MDKIKIPSDAFIAPEKLTRYLLRARNEDDKSRFLAQAGFTQENPETLATALRELITTEEAVSDRSDVYGIFYQVRRNLQGPDNQSLAVMTIWLQEIQSGQYRFVTLKPWR